MVGWKGPYLTSRGAPGPKLCPSVASIKQRTTVNHRRRSWDQRETNWHRMTVQLPPFNGGLGLTPQVLLASLLSTLARALSLDGWRNAHTCATGSDNLSMPEQLVDA